MLVLLAAATAFIVILRRQDQFTHPYVWVEDGTFTIPQLARHGLLSVFEPISGYCVLSSKLISAAAITLSFYYYPEVTCALNLVFTVLVVMAVAIAPTRLRWRWACALLVLFIPTDSECFGVSHYSIYWAGLLVVLTLLWNREGRSTAWRYGLAVLGGLSSPLVIGLLPLFWIRATTERTRAEIRFAVLVTAVAAVQIVLYITTFEGRPGQFPEPRQVFVFLDKNLGYFLAQSIASDYTLGFSLFLLVWIGAGCVLAYPRKQHVLLLLTAAFLVGAGMAAIRQDVEVIHPILGGPRYFFYPYILLFWILAWIAATSRRRTVKGVSVGMILLAVANSIPHFVRDHDPVDWRCHVDRCLASEYEVGIPLHSTGRAVDFWHLKLEPADCGKLVGAGFVGSPYRNDCPPKAAIECVNGGGRCRTGGAVDLILTAPGSRDMVYQIGSSFGTGPIPVGRRRIPLDNDDLLKISITGCCPGIFLGYHGVIDSRGRAEARIKIPGFSALTGSRIHTAFVILDPDAPFRICAISDVLSLMVAE